MSILSSTTIRTALVDYRAELIRMQIKYPQVYKENSAVIKSIDDALLSIEGNVEHVMISAHSCKS
jgi:hypothetical protein